ncbi:hypothetical protein BASA83_001014 [Batrachochytrium salamandrivorans]|nr:hypothetical protein BASA83_001014 [Batrachochytrium salamandrivorans]
MFPSQRFRSIRCPYGSELCPLQYRCYFSHRPEAISTSALPISKASMSTTMSASEADPLALRKRQRQRTNDLEMPAKRATNAGVAASKLLVERDNKDAVLGSQGSSSVNHLQPHQALLMKMKTQNLAQENSMLSRTVAAMETNAAPIHSRVSFTSVTSKPTVVSNTLGATSDPITSKNIQRPPTAAPLTPKTGIVHKEASSEKKHTVKQSPTASINSVPRIQPSMHSKIKRDLRQKTLTNFYNEFTRIYGSILVHLPTIAHDDALKQELALHDASTAVTYSMLASSIFRRLLQRPVSTGVLDVGIDGQWVKPKPEETADSFNTDLIKPFVLTVEQLKELGYPLSPFTSPPSPSIKKGAVNDPHASPELNGKSSEVKSAPTDILDSTVQDSGPTKEALRACDRCGKDFTVKFPLEPFDDTACQYHPGRWRMVVVDARKERLISCCSAPVGALGCTFGRHVFKEENNVLLHQRIPFIELPLNVANPLSVVALDCEMSYTTGGMELTRVTVVDWTGKSILDELCKPLNPIIDLNTRWSGISSLEGAKFDLVGIQKKLGEIMSLNTIIVGHGLENDLRALRIEHKRVIDTAATFPHPNGLPYRYSLRTLASKLLGRFVQTSSTGHDSMEDATTCIDLIKTKLK